MKLTVSVITYCILLVSLDQLGPCTGNTMGDSSDKNDLKSLINTLLDLTKTLTGTTCQEKFIIMDEIVDNLSHKLNVTNDTTNNDDCPKIPRFFKDDFNFTSCPFRIVDRLFDKMLALFDSNITEFISVEDINVTYCQPFPTYYKIAQEFKLCMKPFQQTLLSVVLRGIKKGYKGFCLNDHQLRIAFNHAKCMDSSTKNDFLSYYNKIVSGILHVSRMETEDIIIGACCALNVVIEDGLIELGRICKGKGLEDTPEFAIKVMTTVLSDVLDIACSTLPTVESCMVKRPDIVVAVRDAMKDDVKHSFTPIYPILSIMSKLEEAYVLQ